MATINLLILFLLVGLSSSTFHQSDKENAYPQTKLSILLLHSTFPSHFLSVLSLGAELVSRGHKVTILGPALEGYEDLFKERPESLGMRTIQTNKVSKETFKMYSQSAEHEGESFIDNLKWLYNMSLFFNHKEENYLIKMRETIDTLNGSHYDYVISESATMSMLYYVRRKWSIEGVMLLMVLPNTAPRYISPWPYPSIFSSESDDMSFADRLLNTAITLPLEKLFMPLAKPIFVAEEECDLPFSNPLEAVLHQPTLYITVIGIELPQVILPLQHYLGPLLPPNPPPLDSKLSSWLEKTSVHSPIIYISMGTTTAFINKEMAQSFLSLSSRYRLVWSLRKSNHHILSGLNVNDEAVYISSWVSQFTLLGDSSVKLAILHCGLNGVQEALYNRVPVICIPNGADQYSIALRLEVEKLGLWLKRKEVDNEKLSNAVETILVKEREQFEDNTRKISALFKAAGGVKKGADLVELYAEIGYEHGLPSFIRYDWNFVQYYNIDVWCVLVVLIVLGLIGCRLCCKCFCRRFCGCCCCRQGKEKRKND